MKATAYRPIHTENAANGSSIVAYFAKKAYDGMIPEVMHPKALYMPKREACQCSLITALQNLTDNVARSFRYFCVSCIYMAQA